MKTGLLDPLDRYNSARALRLENRLEDGLSVTEKLWREGYQNPWMAILRGNLWLDLGQYDASHKWYELAWSMTAPNNYVKPEFARIYQDVALALAYSRMRMGYWDQHTWALWEAGRIGKSWNVAPSTSPWAGQPDKLLILSEGGYGDVFLYTRFFQKLDPIQRGASRMVMAPGFNGLRGFRDMWDGVEPVWSDQLLDWFGFRYSTALMSLMAVMGIKSPADIPKAEWMWGFELTADAPTRFGLCWSAEENGVQKRIRSIDNHADMEPLSRWSFVNLCPGKSLTGDRVPRLLDVDLKSWIDTARLICGLDCVVTVDTAVAHLAGLLNVPTLMIVPTAVDWKWGIPTKDTPNDERSFWWPSVRIIRNEDPYSFRPAVERVAEILERM